MERCDSCGQLIVPDGDRPYQAGELLLRPGFRVIERGDQSVRLTPQQFKMLSLLIKRDGALVTREEMLEGVFKRHDGTQPAPKILDVQMCKLRKNLEKLDAGGSIDTTWATGWRFNSANDSFALDNMRRVRK